jgi:ABC-2 type transport system permease protein
MASYREISAAATVVEQVWQAVGVFQEEVRAELLRHARMPGFLLLTLAFPSLLYAAFMYRLSPAHDIFGELSWLANDASLAAIAPGLLAFGVSVAFERQNGFMSFKRALPAPRFGYFGAKLVMCMLVTLLSLGLLILIARLGGRALPAAGGTLRLILVELFGTLPFCALGMLIGSFASGRRAVGLDNLLLVPLAFFSGLLIPLQVLPHALQLVAIFSPGYDLLAMALASIMPGLHASPLHAVFLVVSTILMAALALWRLRT